MSTIQIEEAVVRQALGALEYWLPKSILADLMREDSITALRRALEQPKLSKYEPDGTHHNKPAQKRPPNCGTGHCSCIECLFEPEQPAQQESEAVRAAWMAGYTEGEREAFEQPAQREPVACRTLCDLCVKNGYDFCVNAAKTTPLPQPAQHPDDAAVDRFAAAMKAKMAKQRAKGRYGWPWDAESGAKLREKNA